MEGLYSFELLETLESVLAQHPAFGNSDYIHERLHFCYKRRLNTISANMPVAGQLLDALRRVNSYNRYRVLGDTVVRCAIMHAQTQLETGAPYGLSLDECQNVFQATIRHLEDGRRGSPLEYGVPQVIRLGPEPYHGWVWTEEHSDDVFGRSFRYVIKDNYDDPLCTPNNEELAVLAKGAELLGELLPSLSRSVLSHAHVIAVFPVVGSWKGRASSSQFRVSGTIFLNRDLLQSPWWVAEHLFHESLHHKLYDFRHGHTLLEPTFSRESAPRVWSPWNVLDFSKSNYWDTHRAVAAFHVYVHLALLCTLAEQRAPELEKAYGPLRGSLTMTESRKAFERAHYLGEKIKEVAWQELGLAGKRLIDWLISVLDALDPSPPPRGEYIHLLLDLYQREAKKVESVLSKIGRVAEGFPRQVGRLAKEEVESAKCILSTVNADAALAQFNRVLDRYSDEELGTRFSEVRILVAKTLLDLSPGGYGPKCPSPESGKPSEIVKQMVERGSRRLHMMLEAVPPAVAAALERAEKLRFSLSSEESIGRLLAVLAAAVPVGGRILEIGTGTGVGTGWITSGLGARTDVEVVSVEIDQELSEAVRVWPWPAYVQIVTGNALEALGRLGTFDLVFADTRPSKYGGIERTLTVLRPGGLLLVDDLWPGKRASEGERAEQDALRWSVFGHPDLQAVELEWSSGIILAARRRATSQ